MHRKHYVEIQVLQAEMNHNDDITCNFKLQILKNNFYFYCSQTCENNAIFAFLGTTQGESMSGEQKIWDEHINCVNKKRVQPAREEYMSLLLVSLKMRPLIFKEETSLCSITFALKI